MAVILNGAAPAQLAATQAAVNPAIQLMVVEGEIQAEIGRTNEAIMKSFDDMAKLFKAQNARIAALEKRLAEEESARKKGEKTAAAHLKALYGKSKVQTDAYTDLSKRVTALESRVNALEQQSTSFSINIHNLLKCAHDHSG